MAIRIAYNSKVVSLIHKDQSIRGVVLESGEEIFSNHVILATGHSAREFYHYCQKQKIALSSKPFAVGVRIEHPRKALDRMQYGAFQSDKELGAARYRLSWFNPKDQRGVFSFCMCPGGYVLSSGTEKDALVNNGMSNYARNSPWSNGALVVQVKKGRDFSSKDPLEGLYYQSSIEKKAFKCSHEKASGKELPAMYIQEFLKGKLSSTPLPSHSTPSHIFKQNLHDIFPPNIVEFLQKALKEFDQIITGFSSCQKAVLIAPETRTSSPVTILRDSQSLASISHPGLYPCGEGAGYAGGITSAAADGIGVCEAIIKSK